MWRFYWNLVLRLPELLWASASRLEKIIGVVSLGLTVFGVTAWWPFSPLWGLVPILLFFTYGLLKANYEAFQKEAQKNEQLREDKRALEEKLEEKKKRIALRRLLGEAVTRGKLLLDEDPSEHEALEWGYKTHDLVMAALTTAEAEFLLAGPTTDVSDVQQWMEYRMDQIMQLLQQLHTYDINPDFDPQDWTQ